MQSKFVKDYEAWREGNATFIDFLTKQSDSSLLDLKELPKKVKVIYEYVMRYNLFRELEIFILSTTDKKKVSGLLISTEKSLEHFKHHWEGVFNEELLERATHERLLYSTAEMKSVIFRFSQHLKSNLVELNRIKRLYTDLKTIPDRDFYKINFKKYEVKGDKENYLTGQYSFEDWKSGTLDEKIVTDTLMFGKGIEDFILKEKLATLSLDPFSQYSHIDEEREYLAKLILSRGFLNYRPLMLKIHGLVSLEDWHRIITCQKDMYQIGLERSVKYFKWQLSEMRAGTIDNQLLYFEVAKEIDELLNGKRSSSMFALSHTCDEIREAFLDIKKGWRETWNIRYNDIYFSEDGEKYLDLVVIHVNSHCTSEALFLFQKYLAELITKNDERPEITPIRSYNTLEYALFHFYLQEGKHQPLFEKKETKTKRYLMKEQGRHYGVGEEAFVNAYYSIANGKESKRINKNNVDHLRKVVEMLANYPAGKKIAEEDLRKAEIKA